MEEFIKGLAQAEYPNLDVYIAVLRWMAPVLAALLLLRCARPLITFRQEPEIWAWLCLPDNTKIPVIHWENVIGKSSRSDITLKLPDISKSHAVLTRYDDGSWTITNLSPNNAVSVNGKRHKIAELKKGDVLTICGLNMQLVPVSPQQEKRLAQLRSNRPVTGYAMLNLVLLSILQLLCAMGFLMTVEVEHAMSVVIGFGGIFLCQWVLFLFYVGIRKTAYEMETIAFFLSTMGMAAIATVTPGEATKQVLALVLGMAVFLVVGWSLRDMDRAKIFRILAAVAGIAFLVVTLIFGEEYYGAKNWLEIGSFSIQPSELTKVCFVYVGASAMDRLLQKRNLILFIAYSACVCGCLALMNDFGTAVIFFCAFLIVAYLRSGNVGTIALACASVGYAGVMVMNVAPHALRRFAAWRHVWEYPLTSGYQQTRALMCIASGGLVGAGINRGWLKTVFAADSDIVFATICEEWGLIMASLCVVSILVLGIFAVRSASLSRSSFFAIGSCTAVGILLLQVILNVLGTVDVLPLTGVTFPFLSNGGSSMICAWGLLAFLKAADTRQNSSFAVASSKTGGEADG